MIKTTFKLTGTLDVKVYNQAGELVTEQHIKNLVVDAGKALVANRLKEDVEAAITHIAVGTDGTAAAGAQTTLLGEVARVALTSATVTANSIAYIATFPAGIGTATLLEAGLFNDAVAGTMLSRTASINVAKAATDTLTITWTITVN
jgi:hypothetical protein